MNDDEIGKFWVELSLVVLFELCVKKNNVCCSKIFFVMFRIKVIVDKVCFLNVFCDCLLFLLKWFFDCFVVMVLVMVLLILIYRFVILFCGYKRIYVNEKLVVDIVILSDFVDDGFLFVLVYDKEKYLFYELLVGSWSK